MIWRIRRCDGWLYIYLLLEFQSAVDPWLATRIVVCIGFLYHDLIRKGEVSRGEKQPAVFLLVIYNGRDPWGATRLSRSRVSSLTHTLPDVAAALTGARWSCGRWGLQTMLRGPSEVASLTPLWEVFRILSPLSRRSW